MKIILVTLTLIMTGCASNWKKYQERTDYNLMQCAKMCSTKNIAMIAKFDCACRNNNPGNSSNKNMNYSSSNGNTVYINSEAQNSPSNRFWGAIAGQLMQHEENRLNRLNRDLNGPNQNVVPQNNINNYYMPQNNMQNNTQSNTQNNTQSNNKAPSQFGGFGGF